MAVERISIPDLKRKLDARESFLLIDVRNLTEIETKGAIPGAIHIPMHELERRMADIPQDVEVVFY
jgi:hydroxyacylglutathione hydrolase